MLSRADLLHRRKACVSAMMCLQRVLCTNVCCVCNRSRRMAQVLEAVHRPEQAVVVLQNVLKASHPHQPLQDTPGHQAHISEAAAVALSQPERCKVEGMLAAAHVRVCCR
jgi:hypothetical protein